MPKILYVSLNLFFKFKTGGTKHQEMLEHRYTVQGVSEMWDPKGSLITQDRNNRFQKFKRRQVPETFGFYIV